MGQFPPNFGELKFILTLFASSCHTIDALMDLSVCAMIVTA